MNIFIGGQILDRGVTINNLIGFYYGRKPKKFQQDTVLQHSRMYGNRPINDLAVTRFYTTRDIYEVMKRIHEFDTALRDTIEKRDNEKGIYFIRKDITGKLVPCSPNKLLLSSVATLSPFKRMLPVGFQTGYKTRIENTVKQIDELIYKWFANKSIENPAKINLSDVLEVLNLIKTTLELNNEYPFNWKTFFASIEHLSITSKSPEECGKVWIIVRENKNLARKKTDGRFSDDPDGGTGKTARSVAREVAENIPCIILIKENGKEEDYWRGTSFWWPVLINHKATEVSIFAEETI